MRCEAQDHNRHNRTKTTCRGHNQQHPGKGMNQNHMDNMQVKPQDQETALTEVDLEEDGASVSGPEESPATTNTRRSRRNQTIVAIALLTLTIALGTSIAVGVLVSDRSGGSGRKDELEESTSPYELASTSASTFQESKNLYYNITIPPSNEWDCSEIFDVTEVCEQSVNGMMTLHQPLGFPDHLMSNDVDFVPVVREGDFNVSEYFNVLDHLSLDDREILEYVYHYDWAGGHPLLYARDAETEDPFITADNYRNKQCTENYPCPNGTYLNDIRTDDTPEAFLQLATLQILGGQFYLWWHSNFNDLKMVCNQVAMDQLLETYRNTSSSAGDCFWNGCFSEKERETAQDIDVTPTAQCDVLEDGTEIVRVKVIVFTKWGGFYRWTYTMAREHSYQRILEQNSENLVPFRVGWVY